MTSVSVGEQPLDTDIQLAETQEPKDLFSGGPHALAANYFAAWLHAEWKSHDEPAPSHEGALPPVFQAPLAESALSFRSLCHLVNNGRWSSLPRAVLAQRLLVGRAYNDYRNVLPEDEVPESPAVLLKEVLDRGYMPSVYATVEGKGKNAVAMLGGHGLDYYAAEDVSYSEDTLSTVEKRRTALLRTLGLGLALTHITASGDNNMIEPGAHAWQAQHWYPTEEEVFPSPPAQNAIVE